MEHIVRRERCAAIILAAGQGKRMGAKIQKQFLNINEKPILYYTLETFERSSYIDEIVLVVGDGLEDYCRTEIIQKFGFHKVKQLVVGGKERYESVYNGLGVLSEERPDYVYIHDGARPFVNEAIMKRAYREVCSSKACVAGMPSKDTIKIVDSENMVKETPERKYLWQIQTPQVFSYALIWEAYRKLMAGTERNVTDDAMVLEKMEHFPVKVFEGSYENIKITTPEDLCVAEAFLKKEEKKIDNQE